MRSRRWNCLSGTGKKIFLHFLFQGQPEYQAWCLIRCTIGSRGRIERVFQITEIEKKKKIHHNSWNSLFKKQCQSPGPEMPGRMCNRDRCHTLRFHVKYTIDIHCCSVINNHFLNSLSSLYCVFCPSPLTLRMFYHEFSSPWFCFF